MQDKYHSWLRNLLDYLMLESMKNGRGTHISKLVDFYDFLIWMSRTCPVRTRVARLSGNFNQFNRCLYIDNLPLGQK